MNVNVTFGQGAAEFPVKVGTTDNGMNAEIGATDNDLNAEIVTTDNSMNVDFGATDNSMNVDIGNTQLIKGDKGDPGEDGISPTVAVQDITGGHRVTITDKDGEKTFDVMDGKDGAGGNLPEANPYQQLVTDADGNVVWENRAYYLERRREESFRGTVTTNFDGSLGAYLYSVSFANLVDRVESRTITVVFDREPFEGIRPEETAFGLCAGNLSILNAALGTNYENTGEPFILADITEGGCLLTTNLFGSETHTYAIYFDGNYEYVKTIKDHSNLPYAGEGLWAEAFNDGNTAKGQYSHAEGKGSKAQGDYSHAENKSWATGQYSHAEGGGVADAACSHAEGTGIASGDYSHAEGRETSAVGACTHVEGEFNVKNERIVGNDPIKLRARYVHIVGNGTSYDARSNAHTLDWDGNAWYAGSVYVGSTSGVNRDEGSMKLVANGDNEIILTSPSGTRYRLTVADDGTLTTAAV